MLPTLKVTRSKIALKKSYFKRMSEPTPNSPIKSIAPNFTRLTTNARNQLKRLLTPKIQKCNLRHLPFTNKMKVKKQYKHENYFIASIASLPKELTISISVG